MKTYFITGGAGFIGSNIARALVKRKAKVKIIDNLITGKLENLADIIKKIEFIKGDIRDLELLQKHLKGVDFVLHQAALCSVARSVSDPLSTNNHNVEGTLNVLIAARDQKLKRVIYASSSSIYGEVNDRQKLENFKPDPLSPYAVSKLTGEYYCRVFYKIYKLPTIILRYFNVFGPYQDPYSPYAAVVPKFITAILNNKQPIIYGDGFQSRDFTYVGNVILANLLACKVSKEAFGQVFNIACGKSFNLHDLIKNINQILGKDIKPIYRVKRPGDIKHSQASIQKARRYLGYQPKYTFKEGLKKTILWYTESK